MLQWGQDYGCSRGPLLHHPLSCFEWHKLYPIVPCSCICDISALPPCHSCWEEILRTHGQMTSDWVLLWQLKVYKFLSAICSFQEKHGFRLSKITMFQVAFALCTLSETLTTPKALVPQGIPVYNALTEVQASSPAYYLVWKKFTQEYYERKILYLLLSAFLFHCPHSCFQAWATSPLSGIASSVAASFMLIQFQFKLWHEDQYVMEKQIMKGKQKYELNILMRCACLACFILQKMASIWGIQHCLLGKGFHLLSQFKPDSWWTWQFSLVSNRVI